LRSSVNEEAPVEITEDVYDRAETLVADYFIPMANRAYADASFSETDRAAFKLIAMIRKKEWRTFSSRDVLRGQASGLDTADRLNPVLRALEGADVIKRNETPQGPKGGSPARKYATNPAVFGKP